MEPPLDRAIWEKAFAWSGFAFAFFCLLGLEVVGPQPPDFSASATVTATYYVHHREGILWLTTLCGVSMAFLVAWTIQVGVMLWRRAELPRAAVLVAIASLFTTPALLSFDLTFFGIAAYRAGTISPDLTQALSDVAWIGSMLIWPPLCVGMAVLGVLILRMRGPRVFPRWTGWYSLFCAEVEPFQATIIFYKHGPFGPRGWTTWYAAVFTWGFGILALTYVMVRRSAVGAPDYGAPVSGGAEKAVAHGMAN